nr:hypothetical protein [Pythium aphanidermatum]
MAGTSTSAMPTFDRELHVLYFLKNLKTLPTAYSSQDNQRVVLAFFCVHGLALLGELHRVDRQQIIEWVYSLQVHPDSRDRCTFLEQYESITYDTGNIASTYAALCILKTLGDDLSGVNKSAIIAALRYLQDKNTGSFHAVPFGSEQDSRFVYCACAISYMLDDWSGVDLTGVVKFINSCVSYDGSIGINADTEGQGGAVFCAVASLVLSGRLTQLDIELNDLVRWLVFRQQDGFQGRCNKTPDSCYAFWNGATLELLGKHHLTDVQSCRDFLVSCQFPFGGLCKYPDVVPDVMHSYYSLAWLSIAAHSRDSPLNDSEFASLAPLNVKLQVPHFPDP